MNILLIFLLYNLIVFKIYWGLKWKELLFYLLWLHWFLQAAKQVNKINENRITLKYAYNNEAFSDINVPIVNFTSVDGIILKENVYPEFSEPIITNSKKFIIE